MHKLIYILFTHISRNHKLRIKPNTARSALAAKTEASVKRPGIWLGLAWSGLAWSGLVLSGLGWSGLLDG